MKGTLLIMGDLFPKGEAANAFINGNVNDLFDERILSLTNKSDYTICNLEGAFSDNDERCVKCGPSHVVNPKAVNIYQQLGIKAVNLANNHIMDGGAAGYFSTINTLTKQGIEWFGAGENDQNIQTTKQLEINGIKVAIYSVAEQMFNAPSHIEPGVNLYKETRTIEQIKALKQENEWVIVLYHGGQEFYPFPSPMIRDRFHLLSSCGADLIICQHSHQLIGNERYNKTEIVYGQGNTHLVMNKKGKPDDGVIIQVDFDHSTISYNYHYIIRDGLLLKMSDMPEWFYQNSKRITEGELFTTEFSEFCKEKLLYNLHFYRGENKIDKLYRKLFGKERYNRYLIGKYTQNDLLRILNTLRCDEHREAMITAMEDLIYSHK